MFPIYELPWFSKCQWRGGPCCREGGGLTAEGWWRWQESLVVLCVATLLPWNHAINQVFASNLGSQHWHAAEGSHVGYLPHAPLSMDSLMWIGGLVLKPLHAGRGKRQEASCLLRPPYPPFATADCQWHHLLGSGPPPKKGPWERK